MNSKPNDTIAITEFTGHLLIAMPNLQDPHFSQSVTYIFEHTSDGAAGLIINRPMELTLSDLLKQLSIENQGQIDNQPLMCGGPLETDRGFILHTADKHWDSTLTIGADVCVTTSQDILSDIALDGGPECSMVILGYAGWQPGQLEQEISDNSWLMVPADKYLLFEADVDKRWVGSANKLGIDITLISQQAGHA